MDEEVKALLYKTVRDAVEYTQFDSNGLALGCMMPVYLAHPEEKGLRFDFPSGHMNMKEYMLNLLDTHCDRVDDLNELQEGDIVAINMPFGLFHVGIYLGKDDIIHCTQKTGMELIKLSKYKSRIERGYRYGSSRSSARMGRSCD